ncbi:MAG: S8 family serine peptidase [Planctomycetota bacterium]
MKAGAAPVAVAAGDRARARTSARALRSRAGPFDFLDVAVFAKSGTHETSYLLGITAASVTADGRQRSAGEHDRARPLAALSAPAWRDGELIVVPRTTRRPTPIGALELGFGLGARRRLGTLHALPRAMDRRAPQQQARGWLVWLLAELRRADRQGGAANTCIASPRPIRTTPALYPQQWNLGAIQMPGAWNMTSQVAHACEQEVIVAVVDTGVRYDHPDLQGVFTSTGYCLISDGDAAGNGVGIDPDPLDLGDGSGSERSSYHGTHVAGIIGALTGNGTGVAGINWDCPIKIMPVRVIGKGGGTTFDVANGILYAAGLANSSAVVPSKPAHIINLSLGSNDRDGMLADAVAQALAQGIFVCAAAGNDATASPFYPAALAGVTAVAATTRGATRAYYSNYGSHIAIAAPGGEQTFTLEDGIFATLWVEDPSDARGGTPAYGRYQGTSMACAHVAAVAALVLSLGNVLPRDLGSLLESTAWDIGNVGRDDFFGAGLLDAVHALRAGGAVRAGDPRLRVSSVKLNLASNETLAQVLVTNEGTGQIGGLAIANQRENGGHWLSVSLGNSVTPAVVSVRIDRNGLADGIRGGSFDVASAAGTQTVSVRIEVNTSDPAELGNVVVRMADSQTGAIVAQDIARAEDGYAFHFQGLERGSYRLSAGTDLDGDQQIGDDAGELFGAYPDASAPEPIVITEVRSSAAFVRARGGDQPVSRARRSPSGAQGALDGRRKRAGAWDRPAPNIVHDRHDAIAWKRSSC